jgi:hypothetical protein
MNAVYGRTFQSPVEKRYAERQKGGAGNEAGTALRNYLG